jgi:hypothetical protein
MIQSSTCFIRALYAQNTNVNAYRFQNVIKTSSINTHLFLGNSSISAMSFVKNVTSTCSRDKPAPRLLASPGSRSARTPARPGLLARRPSCFLCFYFFLKPENLTQVPVLKAKANNFFNLKLQGKIKKLKTRGINIIELGDRSRNIFAPKNIGVGTRPINKMG